MNIKIFNSAAPYAVCSTYSFNKYLILNNLYLHLKRLKITHIFCS